MIDVARAILQSPQAYENWAWQQESPFRHPSGRLYIHLKFWNYIFLYTPNKSCIYGSSAESVGANS